MKESDQRHATLRINESGNCGTDHANCQVLLCANISAVYDYRKEYITPPLGLFYHLVLKILALKIFVFLSSKLVFIF